MAVEAQLRAAPVEEIGPPQTRRGVRSLGPLGIASVVVIAIAVVAAIAGTLLAPYAPNHVDLGRAYVGPEGTHLFGYDAQGRDLLSRLIVGARSSMLGPLAVVVLSLAAGTLLALVAAWSGGWIDATTSGVVDILFAFPGILLAVLAAAVFGPSLAAASISLAIAYTPYIARVVRGAALRERGLPYVEALEVQGLPTLRIWGRHLVPNVLPLIVVEATILFGWAMLDLSAISFLGLGVQPPQSDWGVMVSEAEPGVLQGYPAEAIAAGLAIIAVVVAFGLLGERLNEMFAEEQ